LIASLGCEGGSRVPEENPERVVLIVIDTLRRDRLSCYGPGDLTPNIDALAERGQVYTDYTAAYHQTSMSMASLFTGRTPSLEFVRPEKPLFWNSSTWCGLNRFAEKNDDLCIPPPVPTLAERIRESDFWTIGITSNQFLYEPSGFARGFDDWVEVGRKPEKSGALALLDLPDAPKTRHFDLVNRAVLAAVDRRDRDRFFLYVHYMDVHDWGGRSAARYAKAVRSVDWAVGELLRELESRGLLDGSVVVLTSDHGERIGDRHAVAGRSLHRGNPAFQEVLAVPLIIAPAIDRDPAAFLRTQDLHAILVGLAGGNADVDAQLEPDELYLSERAYRTYRRGRFKSAVARADGAIHLFDLASDPGETRDVADENPEIVAAHRRRIGELAQSLSARRAVVERLTEDDRERLRALGYLDQLENPR
jgi:arylsulfatase A-like enzyme